VYRDLKPENILLDEDGYLQLADFGLAKKLEPGEKANSFVGTPDYLAPEIIRNEPYSFQVDWWGMGIIMYHRYL
jgi:serum/glucocorticoid-regulated kinase 2